jgi:hypothetical protein
VLDGEDAVDVYSTSEEERRWYMPQMNELMAGVDLTPFIITADGAICYRIQGLTGSPSILPYPAIRNAKPGRSRLRSSVFGPESRILNVQSPQCSRNRPRLRLRPP